MKNILNYLCKLALLSVLFSLISCEVQEDVLKNSTQVKFKKTYLSLAELKSNTKLISKINEIKSKKTFTDSGRLVYNSEYNFFIDEDRVLKMEYGDKATYTIPILKDFNDNKLENLLLVEQVDGTYEPFISKYNLNQNDYLNIEAGLTVQELEIKTSIIPLAERRSFTIYNLGGGVCGVFDHFTTDSEGHIISFIYIVVDCPLTSGNNSEAPSSNNGGNAYSPNYGTGNNSPRNSNSNNNSPHNSSGNNSSSTLFTGSQPLLSMQQSQIKQFYYNLTVEQRNYLNSLVSTSNLSHNINLTTNSINTFLINNDFSPASSNFVIELLNSCILNNSSFVFNSNVNENNSQVFNNIEEMQTYLDNNNDIVDGSNIDIIDNGPTKTASVGFALLGNSNGIKVEIQQELVPYSITNVNSLLMV